MARIAQSRVKCTHGDRLPRQTGAWDDTSATAMTVACVNNAEFVTRIMPKAGADLPGTENAERKNRTGAAETKTKTENAEAPPPPRLQQQHPVRSHDEPECEPDRATSSSPTCTAQLVFSGNSDLRNVHARRAPGAVPNLLESAAREPE
ncbi:hypothetical protein EDB83DRAFT_2316204 [Lactarius deliciosus]|nr:hypothetical protein EDB83DRAFT_2316204 [Lactarius deliciosus]